MTIKTRFDVVRSDDGDWFWESPRDGVQSGDTFPTRAAALRDAQTWFREASEYGF
jgi:hypothetical protein